MDTDEMDIVEGSSSQAAAGEGADGRDGAEGGKEAPAAWNTPKYREESDSYKKGLADKGFNIADYGDPLTDERPIQKIYSRAFPTGTEERLRGIIAQVQAGAK